MDRCEIQNNADLVKVLDEIWTSGHAVEASQDLQDGVVLEQFYENSFKVYGVKTAQGWEVKESDPPNTPAMRIFYYGDFCERLITVGNLEEFASTLLDLVGSRSIVFIPLRSPEKLVELGFNGFAERLGLPGK